MKKVFISITMLAVICSLCAGCSRGRRGARGDGSDVLGWQDINVDGHPMSGRPGDLNIITSVKFDSVNFEYDRAQIAPSEREKIEQVADYLKRNSGVKLIVEGHCDERGSREYNMALGERRALAVRAYLIGLGIDGSIVQTVSYGEEKPLVFGHDEESWRANRRAEFILHR